MTHKAIGENELLNNLLSGIVLKSVAGEDALEDAIRDAARHIHNTDNSLRSTAEQIRSDLRSMETALDNGFQVNSLGILQSSGRDIERLAAIRDIQINTLKVLLSIKRDAEV